MISSTFTGQPSLSLLFTLVAYSFNEGIKQWVDAQILNLKCRFYFFGPVHTFLVKKRVSEKYLIEKVPIDLTWDFLESKIDAKIKVLVSEIKNPTGKMSNEMRCIAKDIVKIYRLVLKSGTDMHAVTTKIMDTFYDLSVRCPQECKENFKNIFVVMGFHLQNEVDLKRQTLSKEVKMDLTEINSVITYCSKNAGVSKQFKFLEHFLS